MFDEIEPTGVGLNSLESSFFYKFGLIGRLKPYPTTNSTRIKERDDKHHKKKHTRYIES